MPQIQANGLTITYEETGPRDGAPLLFIAGFGTQMTSWPDELHEGLARRGHRVLRFDNRDVGLGQKFSGAPDFKAIATAVREGRTPDLAYTLDDMAADAAGLLDALGIASAHIAGASMGGMIAQLVALNHPHKARSLISIMSTTGDPSLPRSDPRAQEALMTPPPAQDKASVTAHAVKMRRVITGSRYPGDETWLAARIAANYDRSYYPEGQARQWAAILAAPARTERLRRLVLPTLVLHGGDDILIWPEAGQHTAAQISGALYEEIPGWGHDFNPAVAPLLTEMIARFTAGVEERRAEAFGQQPAPGCSGSAG